MKFKVLATSLLMAASAMAADAPKYIFYYIGDGMGLAPVNAAEVYNRDVRHSDTPLLMNTFPQVGWLTTYSYSSPVTDSAAAGTALATGQKTRNYMLGMGPDTTAVQSVAAELFAKGWGVGIATSVAPDDATPGAFYTHVPNRSMFYNIGCDMAESGYQFFAGAGLRGVYVDGQKTDLLKKLKKSGVQIVYGPSEIQKIKSDRVLLLNPKDTNPGDIGYTIDSIPGVLNLPLIAKTCVEHLERTSPDRFFVMIEGGNIDHALHANDGGAAIKEILNFNEALQVAVDFYNAHPDETLIIVTADHDTGGMSLLSSAKHGLKYIDSQRISKEAFSAHCKSMLNDRRIYTWDDMKEILKEKMGLFSTVPVSENDEQRLRNGFEETFKLRNSDDQETLYANFNAFAVDVFSVFNKAAGFAFTTTSHSANPVPVYAIGCGAELFTGYTDNTNISERIRALTGCNK